MKRFVLFYRDVTDPSSEEEARLLSSLKNAKIIDRIPGSILVEATEPELAKATQKFKNWNFSPDGTVTIPPLRPILRLL